MATTLAPSSRGLVVQECSKSHAKPERERARKESYPLRKTKTLEEKEGKVLRKRIRHFRLEHDRQAKSLTRDLMEMKECLKNVSACEDKKRTRRNEDKKEGTDSTEHKQTTNRFAMVEQEPGKNPAKPSRAKCRDNNEAKHKPIVSSSKASTSQEVKPGNLDGVEIQRSDVTSKVAGNKIVNDEELVVSVSEAGLYGVKEEAELDKIAKLNLSDLKCSGTAKRNESRETTQPRGGEMNKENGSKGKEKNARKNQEKLYRTSRVTHINLRDGNRGVQDSGVTEGSQG